MITTTDDNEITELLQRQTNQLQQEIAALPFNQALREETLPLRLYVGQLEAYLAIHRTLEAQLKAHSHPMIRAVWRSEMARTTFLEQDLSNFQADIPTAPVQRAMSAFVHYAEKTGQTNPLALLGIVYALHNLAWAARHILPHLQHAGLTNNSMQNQGVAYYSAYDGDTAGQWEAFQQRMNLMVITSQEKQTIVEHAQETLEYIKNLLKALWQSR